MLTGLDRLVERSTRLEPLKPAVRVAAVVALLRERDRQADEGDVGNSPESRDRQWQAAVAASGQASDVLMADLLRVRLIQTPSPIESSGFGGLTAGGMMLAVRSLED